MEIKKISFGKYILTNNGKKLEAVYYRNGRYDSFDGLYHPTWHLINGNHVDICLKKEDVICLAKQYFEKVNAC